MFLVATANPILGIYEGLPNSKTQQCGGYALEVLNNGTFVFTRPLLRVRMYCFQAIWSDISPYSSVKGYTHVISGATYPIQMAFPLYGAGSQAGVIYPKCASNNVIETNVHNFVTTGSGPTIGFSFPIQC